MQRYCLAYRTESVNVLTEECPSQGNIQHYFAAGTINMLTPSPTFATRACTSLDHRHLQSEKIQRRISNRAIYSVTGSSCAVQQSDDEENGTC
jgi:hypothetical protein